MNFDILSCSLEHLYDVESVRSASRVCLTWNRAVHISTLWRVLVESDCSPGLRKRLSSCAYTYWTFAAACEEGNLPLAKWIKKDQHHPRLFFTYSWIVPIFGRICENGHLEAAKWFSNEFEIFEIECDDDIQGALVGACRNGHLEVAKWLTRSFGFSTKGAGRSFHYACLGGWLELAKWLKIEFSLTEKDLQYFNGFEVLMIGPCGPSHLEVIKWLKETFTEIVVTDASHCIPQCFWIMFRNSGAAKIRNVTMTTR